MMKSKFGWVLLGTLFMFEGIVSLFGYKIFLKYSGWTDISTLGSIYLFCCGIILSWYGIYKKDIEEKYTICPTCKESFHYHELKNGKCKYCEDVDTVDIEEYYKNNPQEKE